MVARRSFLGMLGMTPIAAPMAAKSALSETATSALGSNFIGGEFMGEATENVKDVIVNGVKTKSTSYLNKLFKRQAARKIVETFKPKWWTEEINSTALYDAKGYVYGSPSTPTFPYINAMKSWSNAGKVAVYHTRLMEKSMKEYVGRSEYWDETSTDTMGKEMFRHFHGIDEDERI